MRVERCIITPTYRGHFQYIPKYLQSFRMYVEERDFPVYFIVNREDLRPFEKIVRDYNDLNLNVLCFEDILEHFSVRVTPGVLLDKYGKFSFQSLKKWYAQLYIDPEQSLILDSESMWARPTRMNALFDEYFADPFLACSDINRRQRAGFLFLTVVKNNNYMLKTRNHKWFLEHFCWFYDTAILKDLCAEHGDPLEIVDELYRSPTPDWSLFETLFYHEYIYKNNGRYGYKVIDADEALREALGEERAAAYLDRFYRLFKGEAGILEYAASVVTDSDAEAVARLFADSRFRLLRCEFPSGNYAAQKRFVELVNPNIFAVSQGHVYGLNKGAANRVLEAIPDVDLGALRDHAAAFAEPVRGAARWLKEGLLASWHGTGAVYKGARHEWEAWREDRSYDDADRRRPGGPS